MTIGAGIAVAGMWIALSVIILGYQKITNKEQLSAFGVIVLCVVAALATGSIATVH